MVDDFNLLYDKDVKKFCVLGDLFFLLVLNCYGISEKMEFIFVGMVDENLKFIFFEGVDEFVIIDGEKVMLKVKWEGVVS